MITVLGHEKFSFLRTFSQISGKHHTPEHTKQQQQQQHTPEHTKQQQQQQHKQQVRLHGVRTNATLKICIKIKKLDSSRKL